MKVSNLQLLCVNDMIETYKIINEKYDKNVLLNISRNDDARTRGNSLKLKSIRTHYNLRKYSFSIRIINIWNSLPENVVTARLIQLIASKLDLINSGILRL